MAVIPLDCMEESPLFKSLHSISYITIRIKSLSKSEMIETKIEQRSRTNADSIKSVRFRIYLLIIYILLF